jgi:glycosyltransferase involved in cell wall biosynthesis
MNKTISIIHPSRGRALSCARTAFKWTKYLYQDIQYLLSVDSSDSELSNYKEVCEEQPDLTLVINDNHSAIEAINNAAKIATGDIIIVISDDFDCPQDWDTLLLDALKDKSDFLVKTVDGCQPWIITLPIMDRVYYNRFGYIYNPSYLHMFCDTEMTHVGHLLGRVITLPISFPHMHYTQVGGQPKDEINVKNDATWNQGEEVYLRRMKENFGLSNTADIELPKHHINWLRTKGVMI